MDTDTLQIAKRSVEDLSIIVNALLTPDPLKSIVAGIPSVVLQIIRILETQGGIRDLASRTSRLKRIVNYDPDASKLAALKLREAKPITCIQKAPASSRYSVLEFRLVLEAAQPTQDAGGAAGEDNSLDRRWVQRWSAEESPSVQGSPNINAHPVSSAQNSIYFTVDQPDRNADVISALLVLLLDRLDDYGNELTSKLLHVIGKRLDVLPNANRLIITSRPEPHLTRMYEREPMKPSLEICYLELEHQENVERDIEKSLQRELPEMVWRWVANPLDWPGEERRRALARLSQGLWIWAVTVARMLANPNYCNPEQQLDALLTAEHTSGGYEHDSHPYSLYSNILNRACLPSCDPKLLALFREILETLLIVHVSVNINTLALILCSDRSSRKSFTHRIRMTVLGCLQAVLIVPDAGNDDPSRDAAPIRFIRKSSSEDFLTDDLRCDSQFPINPRLLNRQMTIWCLSHSNFRRNICGLDLSQPHLEVNEFQQRAQDTSDLSFMPIHSPQFQAKGHMGESDPRGFVEVVCNSGRQQTIIACCMFMWPALTPHVFNEHVPQEGSTGEPNREALTGHRHEIYCVAWSPDGKKIISGSHDGTLHLWDSLTGTPIGDAWKDHSLRVVCIA
ncbi:hypothetical protein FRB97_009718 [Tulasnella sp. 331]|nr:hypothetical protein FRB97_009718 [Tulasnella sp. 331]